MMQNGLVSTVMVWIKEKVLLGLSLGREKNLKCRGGRPAVCAVLLLLCSICPGSANSVALVLVEDCAICHSITGDIFKAL